VRKRLQSLQGTLDQEGDARERFARQRSNMDGGANTGLMSSLGYSTKLTANAGVVSRLTQMKNSRTTNTEMGNDPLNTAKGRTEKLNTRLHGEEEARKMEIMMASQQAMEAARRNVYEKSQNAERLKMEEFAAKNKKMQAYHGSVTEAMNAAVTDMEDQARLQASQAARARRADAMAPPQSSVTDTITGQVQEAVKALPYDATMAKLGQGIARLSRDVKHAEVQYAAASDPRNYIPGFNPSTPDHWAGRVEDATTQLIWMVRQATRRAQELGYPIDVPSTPRGGSLTPRAPQQAPGLAPVIPAAKPYQGLSREEALAVGNTNNYSSRAPVLLTFEECNGGLTAEQAAAVGAANNYNARPPVLLTFDSCNGGLSAGEAMAVGQANNYHSRAPVTMEFDF